VKFPAGILLTVKSYFTPAFFSILFKHFNCKHMNIFVSSLSFSVTDEDLKQLFSSYGDVSSAKVIIDKATNRSKGFGFVEMAGQTEGDKAIKELNGSQFQGRTINVNVARPREERTGGNDRGDKRSFTNNRW